MARVNIYVPDELRKDMTLKPDYNWSQIACTAFIAALTDANASKKPAHVINTPTCTITIEVKT